MKYTVIGVMVLVLIAGFYVFTSEKDESVEFNYKVVNTEDLSNDNLDEWYEENKMNKGIYLMKGAEKTHILVAAGEKRSGGYSLELSNVAEDGENVTFEVKLNEPEPNQPVIEVLTYPTLLIETEGVEKENIKVEYEEEQNEEEQNEDVFTSKEVIYVGQIDSNSIEVEITDVLKEELDISQNFLALSLKDSDQKEIVENLEEDEIMVVDFYKNENEQWVLEAIYFE